MHIKISTEIASAATIAGMEKAVELCAKAGFDAWDFSMFDMGRVDWVTGLPLQQESQPKGNHYLKVARELRKIRENNGIVCNQSHVPFPVEDPAIRSYLECAIECTAEVGGEICVIHPDDNKTAVQNAEMYAELLPFAKTCDLRSPQKI